MAARYRETDIDHHGTRPISIICHLPDPPHFSLPTSFNADFESVGKVVKNAPKNSYKQNKFDVHE